MAFKIPISRALLRRLIGLAVLSLTITVILVILAVFYGWSNFARSLPELKAWHTQMPASEFQASDEAGGYSFEDYVKQEDQVFKELESFIEGDWKSQATGKFCRFRQGSVSNPVGLFVENWNRSRVIDAKEVRGGVLMLHGLSDSPYSMKAMSERMLEDGYTVMVLRVPGHGTCPGALAEVEAKDWMAAVRVGARGLQQRIGKDKPLVLMGFSNGGALSVHYAMESVEDSSLPKPAALMLMSPMIGIAPMARITRYHKWIAGVSGEPKAHWSGIAAEIDPFKYSSWPMNASVQAWEMTQAVEQGLARLEEQGRMDEFPPVLACQSAIDATVKVGRLIDCLFERVTDNGSELLVFDINRAGWLESLVDLKFEKALMPAFENESLKYELTLVSNQSVDSAAVQARTRDGASVHDESLDQEWPMDIFSLSHSALPFPEGDPVYGAKDANSELKLPLGALDFKGESGALMISDGQILRLRHNPFFPFMERHMRHWLKETMGSGVNSN